MDGSNFDLGPEWMWKLVGLLALVGIISGIIWLIKGVMWLFNHIQIV